MSDKEIILTGWIQEESKRIGRPLLEGLDYEVRQEGDALLVTYYTDPDNENIQIFEITDTPVIN